MARKKLSTIPQAAFGGQTPNTLHAALIQLLAVFQFDYLEKDEQEVSDAWIEILTVDSNFYLLSYDLISKTLQSHFFSSIQFLFSFI